MYDVKQVDPAEWSSPPWAGSLVEKPGVGTVLVGRGAVNQKGPEASFLAALHAVRGAGRKLPVNLVLVAEGEEEIGSPHFAQIVRRPEALAALRNSIGIFMPSAAQELDGKVIMTLGAKGVIEVELVSSGERWGRGPQRDIHSSNKARVDKPGVAPGRSPRNPRLFRRQRSRDRRVRRQGATALSRGEGHDRGSGQPSR